MLIALGGAFAFSAFSGSSGIVGNSTAGHLSWEFRGTLIGSNATNTPVTVMGPNNAGYTIYDGSKLYQSSGIYNLPLGDSYYHTYSTNINYTVNATNFAPGDYIELQFVLVNNGTVGFIASIPSPVSIKQIPTSCNVFIFFGPRENGNNPYNPDNKTIESHMVSPSNFTRDLYNDTGWIYSYSASGFGTSMNPGSTAVLTIWIGLGNSGNLDVNHYQDSKFSFTVPVNIVSDP
ncbi:hypothetical protein [Picrophilus oshimae]|uniref:Hypothetical membrane associated protein n=1 Tax=Picrophilus torridus (strain ATCC 700027 / DSM 9790 / JCM 10055 / NBRC 100828 / KAW 2/3) TaxID=1122961 RepID=Q6L304_PICTO|nr:hypothetical protein [Picrophilus oshimae]AAT42647.1 hypothetical membrane associated protein [Picrophilus oshimae DSM 9789]SMD31439.1 hypothetical protein SAMN02745355_1380 [Picrophilus oshimae DSM 9789]